MTTNPDPLMPLADAIADRVWAEVCQGKSGGLRVSDSLTIDRRGSVLTPSGRFGKPCFSAGASPPKPVVQNPMDYFKGDTSDALQLQLNAWLHNELRDKFQRKCRMRPHWLRVLGQMSLAQDVNFDNLIQCVILCSDTQSPDYAGVYFARAGGLVKIGRSRHCRRRMASLRAVSPFPLVLEAHVRGTAMLEKFLHITFWEYRAHGEWFFENPLLNELVRVLKTIASTPNKREYWRR